MKDKEYKKIEKIMKAKGINYFVKLMRQVEKINDYNDCDFFEFSEDDKQNREDKTIEIIMVLKIYAELFLRERLNQDFDKTEKKQIDKILSMTKEK